MAPNNNKSTCHAHAALLLVVAAAVILGQEPRGAQAQGLTNIPVNVMTSGIVPCTAGINVNPATALAFPSKDDYLAEGYPLQYASTQLVCGSTVVANVTTSSTGAFIINLGTLTNLVANTPQIATALLNNQCRVVVTTPLAACNVSLAGVTGTLTSPVQLLNTTAGCAVGAITGQAGVGGLLPLITGLFSRSA